MIGEVHDRYDHHLNQLELVCRLHRRHANLAIGLEFFQQPFQAPPRRLPGSAHRHPRHAHCRPNTTIAGITTTGSTRRFWNSRARAGIPLVALNAPKEISSKVAQEGLAGLSEAERAQFPAQLEREPARLSRTPAGGIRRAPGNPAHELREFRRGPAHLG